MNMAHSTPVDPQVTDTLKALGRVIGNTPLLVIELRYKGEPRTLYAKSEQLNMTGSIKDRMALHILETAYREGLIHRGDMIAEATSGNTGISFAALGRALGHPVTIFMPDWMSRERVDLIRSFGATIVPVTREQGGFVGSIKMAEDLAATKSNVFLPSQFSNQANVRAHEMTTGPEIWWQLQFNSMEPDAFIAGIGTGGTIMGVGAFLKSKCPNVKIHPLEPAESPTLSTGGHKIGHHRIQGISDEFIPAIVDLGVLDKIVRVNDGDAILMAQQLACKLGLGVGISSGANFVGALKVQNELGPKSVVVTVFPDDNKKYLSTSLLSQEPVKPDYLTPDVELLSLKAFKRVCQACCEMYDCSQRVPEHALEDVAEAVRVDVPGGQ
ncbi:MAG: cysteine synthase family protein [candidate division Zixibacteria bacterium]|nr:cysteine synthase family protein [candidate division Zixibacteria bacterium]